MQTTGDFAITLLSLAVPFGMVTCQGVKDTADNPDTVQHYGLYEADFTDKTLLPVLEPKEREVKEDIESDFGNPEPDWHSPDGYPYKTNPDTGLPELIDPGDGSTVEIPNSQYGGQEWIGGGIPSGYRAFTPVEYETMYWKQVYSGYRFRNKDGSVGPHVLEVNPQGYRVRIPGTTWDIFTPRQYRNLYESYKYLGQTYGFTSSTFSSMWSSYSALFDPRGHSYSDAYDFTDPNGGY